MKMYLSALCALALTSCLSSKISPSTEDSALIYQQEDGQIMLSSLSSPLPIKIVRHQQVGDTLFVTYRRGAFLTPNSRVPLTGQTTYLKCANRSYKVEKTASGFQLAEQPKAAR
ncbi:hypothetical protein [Hymenobacter cellulosilyticus]|uniref:Lysozyme inhibitor n=1 Tax=Hymenobacter cellulosilyticus TaxID=2932248 RepID=A0A8T9Q692_9BACT|nr:hypothetical protein [Hymenobacter cellulosilyticus]UOQ73084.1 hypothetical protein MUN79_03660 [Hymenobacter cellulosilyticus]